jgi:leucyl-tRNA synthetase
MRDLGMLSFDEPFTNLLTQGMVLNHIFQRKSDKGGVAYFAPEEIDVESDASGRILGAKAKADGQPVEYAGIGTMSKSKRNGVDPQALIEEYGADTARFFIIFTSPPEQTLEWSDSGVDGSSRFLRRVWSFAAQWEQLVLDTSKARGGEYSKYAYAADLSASRPDIARFRRELHATLSQATYDLERQQFNTVASAAMKILNALQDLTTKALDVPDARAGAFQSALHEGVSILLRVMSPVTPHIAHALWQALGYAGDLIDVKWPEVDSAAIETDEVELVIQVNGKLRGHLRAPRAADKTAIETLALASEIVQKHTNGAPPKKVVVVPGRLVNVVV